MKIIFKWNSFYGVYVCVCVWTFMPVWVGVTVPVCAYLCLWVCVLTFMPVWVGVTVPVHVCLRVGIPGVKSKFSTRSTLCYKCIMRTLLCLITVTVFSFTHPPLLPSLLLILLASIFLLPDFPLLISLAPQHGMPPPPCSLLSFLDSLIKPQDIYFSKTIDLPCFVLHLKFLFVTCLRCP